MENISCKFLQVFLYLLKSFQFKFDVKLFTTFLLFISPNLLPFLAFYCFKSTRLWSWSENMFFAAHNYWREQKNSLFFHHFFHINFPSCARSVALRESVKAWKWERSWKATKKFLLYMKILPFPLVSFRVYFPCEHFFCTLEKINFLFVVMAVISGGVQEEEKKSLFAMF